MKFVPHAYQRYCITRLLVDAAMGLFLDMGLGKTVITLTVINDLKFNRFAIGKALVIAPKKVAEATWSKEAAKWDHLQKLRVVPVMGDLKKRIRALNTPGDVYVISRDNVVWLVEYFRNAWPFDMVVADEFTSFKNPGSKRFKALSWVRWRIQRFVGLTGTPAPNGLLDLWAQLFLLDSGKRLGSDLGGYRTRYFEADQRDRERIFSYAPKPGADEIIRELIGDICVSMKAEDYLDLPPITYNTIPVMLDPKAQKAYDTMERDMLLQIEEDTIDAGTAAILNGKLLQLCNGAVYDEFRKVVEVHDCKIEAFMELIEGLNGKHALVFYQFQHDLVRLQAALAKTKLRVRVFKTSKDEDDWNLGLIDILLAHPASTAYGLNLQEGGNHIIKFSRNYNLELDQQGDKRLHRQGQTQKVIIHTLAVIGGADEYVIEALEGKAGVQDKLMNGLKARISKVKEGAA